ncbi:PREDICTED: centrosomal protein of 126 kDa isoform X1 [Ceratotherium simum simum]|uniref:Centrosomal protein of 126 kDa isoform X1 n=1 Tax=Ceratotherium simum simum TaxID=73337 RepID=A0ABM1CMC6_CERSS|nr:PREDICTED: centrosomal protein of 126 kDa isoform X1 [Ceratotherium simum simum]
MLAGRPGVRSAVAGLGAESSDARDRAPLSPRLSGGRHRPGAYLDMKIHLEKNLEEERQILLQQQKICRNRARRYFVESNRRRKAFEEKQKEQEEREHQIREQILQQRKQKFEEVTEKFQRAHIPLSQRRRAVFQKPVPPLEEALKQIQESNLKSEVNLPSSHRPTINRRTINNALVSSLSKNDHKHQKHLLSKINCDKEMKENSRANLTTNKDAFQLKLEETQKLLEDQHLSSLQKFRDEVNQITNSETLSSIDSLEAGAHEEIYLTLNKEPSTSIQQNSVFLTLANLQSTNLSCFDEDKLSFSKTQRINNWLTNLDDPNTQTVTPFSDILSKPNVLPSCECFNSKEQNTSALSRTVERATDTADNSVAFVYSPPIFVQDKKSEKISETSTMRTTDSSSGAFKKERPLVTESPTFKFSKAWTTPDSLSQEMAAFSDQKKYSELTQEKRTTSIPTSFVPVTTPLVLPSNRQSARPLPNSSIQIKEIDPVQCSDKLGELEGIKDEKIKYFNFNKEELPFFSDDLQAAYIPHNSDSKDKKQKIAETPTSLSNIISNCDLVGQHKKMKYDIHERNGVKFLKSILKKESKYEHDCFKALVINQGFKLGSQKAAIIRDSIELTKEKGKGSEIPKTIKKLRWFDETGDTEKNAEDNHSLKNRLGISQQWSHPFHIQTESGTASNIISVPTCAINSADRKKPKDDSVSGNVTASETPGIDHVPLNCFIPSGCNIAKHALSASKREESKSPVDSGDSKTQKANPQSSRAKVIRRTRPAKVQSGFIYTNRKGTVIRPQSASKANTFLQAQGKLIVPHPPPKSPSNIRSGKNIQVSQCQLVISENSQNIISHNYFNSNYVLPAENKLNQWNQESSLPLSHVCSDLDTVMPSLPYCSSECQTLAKINHSNGIHMVAQQDETLHYTQRCPVYEESHHSVTLRTTKEESVPLWKRQHNILGQNEKAADSTVIRRKRIVENKQRTLLEQKRENPGSVGQKYSEQMNNFGQSVQLSSSEPKQTTRGTSNIEEVSDSTSEFLMAENLVNASVPEDEILTVMNSKQLQKSNLASNKTQRFNICALSAEEQKILQSLNRLNERLHLLCTRNHLQKSIHQKYLTNNTISEQPAKDQSIS